jgi:hypothetical protein
MSVSPLFGTNAESVALQLKAFATILRPLWLARWMVFLVCAAPQEVRKWRRGLDTIPDDVFVALNALPNRSLRGRRKWTEAEARKLAALVRAHKPRGAIAYSLGRTPAQIVGQLSRPLPYEAGVPTGAGPMSVEELWRIGISLFGPGWRREVPIWLGRPDADILRQGLTASECSRLREAYHQRSSRTTSANVIQLGPPPAA